MKRLITLAVTLLILIGSGAQNNDFKILGGELSNSAVTLGTLVYNKEESFLKVVKKAWAD